MRAIRAISEENGWTRPSPDARSGLVGVHRGALREAELRQALANRALEARYHPVVDMATHQPVGMEALVRLNLAHRGTLYPGDFLPQIEKSGLTATLTDALVTLAFSEWTALPLAQNGLVLAVNFPLDVLLSPTALELLDERREAAGLAAHFVLIELTERHPVDDLPSLRRSVEHVRRAGYMIALDDLTPSVPHLRELIELPFTCLKLDKAVVAAAHLRAGARAFTMRMVSQARKHGMRVTAEGVEDETNWQTMRALGVDMAQGHLIGRPMHAADIPAWRAGWSSNRPV